MLIQDKITLYAIQLYRQGRIPVKLVMSSKTHQMLIDDGISNCYMGFSIEIDEAIPGGEVAISFTFKAFI